VSKTDELGASRLALSEPSLAERIEAQQKQNEILRAMRDVVSDHRGVSVHSLSGSMIPERPTPPTPQTKGSGWADPVPLSNPDGVAQCDRLVDAFEEEERRSKK
jgi:hypothetical protein